MASVFNTWTVWKTSVPECLEGVVSIDAVDCGMKIGQLQNDTLLFVMWCDVM